MGKVELLAPVGDRDALIAAVQNGADAVYLGGRLFGARANASNFDGDGLAWAVDYCHLHGVKLYMTINTLVRDDEMRAVYDMAAEAVAAGIDAAIVQDLGVAQMLKESFPHPGRSLSRKWAWPAWCPKENARWKRFPQSPGPAWRLKCSFTARCA